METKTVAPGITRFDRGEAGSGDGFMVRICRDGKRLSEFFSDKRCGRKRKAAEARYEELCQLLGPVVLSTNGQAHSPKFDGQVWRACRVLAG